MDSQIATADERQELLDRLAEDRAEIDAASTPLAPRDPCPPQAVGPARREGGTA